MAEIRYKIFLGLRDPHAMFDADTFGVQAWSGTKLVLKDGDGAGAVLGGTGFKVAHGDATAGIATSVTLYDATGNVLMTIRHSHLDATDISANLDKYGVTALLWTFAAGDDHVTGTGGADHLQGDYGDDLVSGGRGNDILEGYSGSDRVNGGNGRDRIDGGWGDDLLSRGQGADKFVFQRGSDVDTITDWQDGGKGHDRIMLDAGMWQQMDKYQDGRDVVLNFGDGDRLIIIDEKASHITHGDFIFAG